MNLIGGKHSQEFQRKGADSTYRPGRTSSKAAHFADVVFPSYTRSLRRNEAARSMLLPHFRGTVEVFFGDEAGLILGNDAAGKTTLLRVIALAFLGAAVRDFGIFPYQVARGCSQES